MIKRVCTQTSKIFNPQTTKYKPQARVGPVSAQQINGIFKTLTQVSKRMEDRSAVLELYALE